MEKWGAEQQAELMAFVVAEWRESAQQASGESTAVLDRVPARP